MKPGVPCRQAPPLFNAPFGAQLHTISFTVHAVVMLVLQTTYNDVVAVDSIVAMTIRLTVWIVILSLMFFQLRKNKLYVHKGNHLA